MPLGVIFALLSYSLYSFGDAIVKSFSGEISVFEIGFFATLFSLIPAVLAKRPGEHWRHAWKMQHPGLVHLRAFVGLVSSILVIYAFTTIPLAETYAIVFLTPLFLNILSLVVLKEKVEAQRWIFGALSFIGVMIVVRPGFRELHLGHLTAFICAFFAAASTTLLRVISGKERRLSIIAVNSLYSLVGNGILMASTFVMLPPHKFGMLALMGLVSGTAQLVVIAALKLAPANQVGPAQYVQILWAVLLGAVFYHEFPDRIATFGLVIVVAAGVMNIFADGARARIAGRFSEFRARRGGPKFTGADGPDV
jgi:drug/metabolite transporter (DMT)-like permease